MARLRSLPESATLIDVYATYADLMMHLPDFLDKLLRGPSPFSDAERELISAYVCGVNGCEYCYLAHAVAAEELGIGKGVPEAVVKDVDAAPIEARLRPVLRYVGKLTLAPMTVTDADTDAVYQTGWDDTALFHATLICAHFNFVTRIAGGAGLSAPADEIAAAGRRLAARGYVSTKEVVAAQFAEAD